MNLSLDFPEFPAPSALVHPQGLEAALTSLRTVMHSPDSPVRAIRHEPAAPGVYAELPEAIEPSLRQSLDRRGIRQLYCHQAEAYREASAGRNVVVVTPTASGKTLCYNLPVLDLLLRDPGARSMYLFPTKALAEDQLHELQSAIDDLGAGIRAFTYDGDTPQDARKAIRQRANIVLTNPDMLHAGILPHHTRWAKLFENLRFLVIDELHYYRGVYGSHLANLLRRLKRICEFYGSKPVFLCSSATIANPRELAQALTGEDFQVVDRNGAPRGEKFFVFYNPPVVNRQLGIRRSYIHETRRLALEFIERRLQTLVFANNRLATEVLVTYLKDACERGPWPRDVVRGYRGGYLPRERREIERLLRQGDIRAVVATNALELGIDIGSLDAVVMAGYPGTIASTWQRAGRAGRRQGASAAVLVASSAPVDQYIVEHPEYFFGRSPEHAYINADNLEILLAHLKCAAFELPIRESEQFGRHPVAELCRYLEESGLLHYSAGAWHWTSETYPADATSLRAVTSDNFVVVDTTGEPQVIGEVSFPAALTSLHEKAIYLHEARQYHVERFDYEERKAYVRRVECDYYTDAIDYTKVQVLEEVQGEALGGARKAHGDVRVNRQIVGFKKIKFYTHENVGAGNLSMPEQEMHTTAFWLHFPAAFLARFADLTPTEKQSGLAGLGNALRTVASLLLMCDPHDLGTALSEEIAGGLGAFAPNLYLYDNYPGGVGQSAPLFRLAPRLLAQTAELLAGCACEAGCPSCVGPAGEIGERGKETAARFLRELLAEFPDSAPNAS
ncbi:MAG TPA: DEAD/DEAH box helicase [Bryobacteraceae bacterium]|nr:DEAD/DEAH box helicase [Bryobacteraceae bacterium]